MIRTGQRRQRTRFLVGIIAILHQGLDKIAQVPEHQGNTGPVSLVAAIVGAGPNQPLFPAWRPSEADRNNHGVIGSPVTELSGRKLTAK